MKQYYYNHMNIFMRHALVAGCIVVGIVIISSCLSASTIQDDAIVPFDTDFISGTLDNGLQYFIRHNEWPKKRATVQLAIKAGSIHEEENQRGIAHFLEHMGFNGTKHFPKNSLIDFFERIGMSFGAHLNAYTSFDETVYRFDIPTDDTEIFDQGLQIIQDWLQYLSLDAEGIEKERGVVLGEWRSRLGAYDRFYNTSFPIIFQDSRYAERLPLGLPDIIEHAPKERFLSFYQKWYRPENAAIVITGDVDTEKIQNKLEALFASDVDTKTAKTTAETAPVPPLYHVPILSRDEPAVVLFDDDEASLTEISILYKAAHDPYSNTVGALKKEIIHGMMMGAIHNRLANISEQKDTPISSAYVSEYTIGDASLLSFSSDVKHGKIHQAYSLVLEEIEKLRRYGILESELQLIHEGLLKNINRRYKEQNKKSNQYWGKVGLRQFLMEDLSVSVDIDWLHKNIKALLSNTSLEQINAVLSKYLNSPDVSIALFGPDKTAFPSEDKIIQSYENMAQLDITAPSDIAVRDQLMTELPKLGKIVKEIKLPGFDIYQLDLENGATVLYKITNFRADTIHLDILRPGGRSQLDAQSYKHASMFFDVFDNSGYSFITPEELRRFLDTKIGYVGLYVSAYGVQGYGYTNNDDLETMLQQLYLKISAPYISDVELDNAKERAKSDILQHKNNPEQVFYENYRNASNNNDARTQALTNKDVDTVTAQKLYALRSQLIDGVKDFTFVFVGNISPKPFKKLIRRYIASLPAGSGKKIPVGQDIIPTFETSVTQTIKKGKEPKSIAILKWAQDIKTPPSVQELIVGKVLSSLLDIRVTETLREKEGKTYSPSGWVRYNMLLDRVTTRIRFTSDPVDVDDLVRVSQSLIDELRLGNISEENIKKAKKIQIKGREPNMQKNGWWASIINTSIEVGYDLQEYVGDTFNEKVNNVTKEMLVDFAKKYISDDRKLEMFLFPESE